MSFRYFKIIIGFVLLFTLYHAAEYFVLFTYNPIGFLSFQAAFFLVAWLLAKWQGFSGLAAWGLGSSRGWVKHLALGMRMGVMLYGGAFAFSLLLKSEEVVQVPSLAVVWPQLVLFTVGTFFSSFSEDVLTRGYVYKHLSPKVSGLAYILISSVIYLLNHIYRLTDGVETLMYLFLLGVLFAIPLVFTKRLWVTGGMHWMGNTTFFFTHSATQIKEGQVDISPNTIFILWMLLFIPLTILFLQRNKAKLFYGGNDHAAH